MALSKVERFESLCKKAGRCRLCPELADKAAVLSPLNGTLRPRVMFIAEAPGRQGADRTRRPFYGDKSGANFQTLIDSIGLKREEIFITNAVMCSPRSGTDANRKPKRSEMRNCSDFLEQTIELIDPPVVATLGAVALDAIKMIKTHEFSLKSSAGTVGEWKGRKILPLYHPSPQVVAAQRGLDLQMDHFQVLARLI
ncbi:MAG TPA: uracil-DNA glycosylase [Pyrinomonadaceae bacterium]